ncbi:T9SS type A sorting domain-containing protein [Pontibacter burrus]|uniref:T9SS type A sorting domain-containing protein n=1 Tax=Pontibacter burrus TaxID=2704466 RepID=A0A6B3LX70_9BACT|nr:T9SS type A sorting domain-containing protein [Pontibacter burrus]NEM98024.1 T9SS type A sorting domain-containing protein [Pontibacter burrus]
MKQLLLLVCLALLGTSASATHLLGGFITYTKDASPNANPRKVHFKLTLITDEESPAHESVAKIDMGDGNVVDVALARYIPINKGIARNEFTWDYTFPSDGQFSARWTGLSRNGNILNMSPPSDQINLSIMTELSINSLRGPNSGPQFLAPEPININAGQPIHFNLLAYDPDGDSLAYKISAPLHKNQEGLSVPVPGYKLPSDAFSCNKSAGSGAALFDLHPRDGQLTWDAPCRVGEYTIAVLVEEWRGKLKLGYVTYDMTIRVNSGTTGNITLENTDELKLNRSGHIEAKAGQELELKINYNQLTQAVAPIPAPSGQTISQYFASELTQLFNVPVSYTFENTANGIIGTFRFTPTKELIREKPYFVSFYGIKDSYFTTASFGILVRENEPILGPLETEKTPRLQGNYYMVSTKETETFKVLAEAFPGYTATVTAQSSIAGAAKKFTFTTSDSTAGTIGTLELQPSEAQISISPYTIKFTATYTPTESTGSTEPIIKELNMQVMVYRYIPNSIKRFLDRKKFFIFPSLVYDNFSVEAERPVMLSIYTLQGKLILEQKLEQGTTEISRPDAPVGLYFYTLTTEDGQKRTAKLLLK